jgi:hypothetical protein
MDSKMIPILKQALPDLRTISGIYYPDIEESGKNNQDSASRITLSIVSTLHIYHA